jgi:hypothetical protein
VGNTNARSADMSLETAIEGIVAQNRWFLLLLFIAELAVKITLNWKNQFALVDDPETYNQISQRQRGAAISVAGLVFAGLAFIVSNNPSEYVRQIELFVAAFGFLLVAVFAHELTLTYRVVLTVQEMAFEYGLLFIAYALYVLVYELVPGAALETLAMFVFVLVIRFFSLKGELKAHRND